MSDLKTVWCIVRVINLSINISIIHIFICNLFCSIYGEILDVTSNSITAVVASVKRFRQYLYADWFLMPKSDKYYLLIQFFLSTDLWRFIIKIVQKICVFNLKMYPLFIDCMLYQLDLIIYINFFSVGIVSFQFICWIF